MKGYKGEGQVLTLVAPTGGVVTGVGYMIGSGADKIFAVAESSVAQTLPFAGLIEGAVDLPKEATTAAFVVGEKCYWDDTAKRFDESAAGRFYTAFCIEAAGATATTVKVKLLGTPAVAV